MLKTEGIIFIIEVCVFREILYDAYETLWARCIEHGKL